MGQEKRPVMETIPADCGEKSRANRTIKLMIFSGINDVLGNSARAPVRKEKKNDAGPAVYIRLAEVPRHGFNGWLHARQLA